MIDAVGSICQLNVFYLSENDKRAVWEAVDAPELARASSLPCNVRITHAGADRRRPHGSATTWASRPQMPLPLATRQTTSPCCAPPGDGVAMANRHPECCAADRVTASCRTPVWRLTSWGGAPLSARCRLSVVSKTARTRRASHTWLQSKGRPHERR